MRALRFLFLVAMAAILTAVQLHAAPDGNRLAYLDSDDPFYPHRDFPKLITPQWIGEPGVEAVVILAIDDMRETAKYESFLRPILERLKQIDGRAPVSILANAVTTTNAQLQAWLKEGLSLEVHTLTHPCPLLQRSNFTAAADTYHGGVDLLNSVPGNQPVAFRMPCCDSMNSPSPRFYAEMFSGTNARGQFLTIDSSVMCLLTPQDKSLPRELVLDAAGRERFRKYFPRETNATTRLSLANFGTYIEDYPYPYVIGRAGWEFPGMVPSDWEAFNVLGPTNATLLADWQAALDAVVLKQGVFTMIFHPHGWSTPQQLVALIDHAVARHGRKVKFLTFREAQERLNKNLLAGEPLRAGNGGDNGIRLIDVNNDGYLDVLQPGLRRETQTKIWNATARQWALIANAELGLGELRGSARTNVRFGILDPSGFPVVFSGGALWRLLRLPGELPAALAWAQDLKAAPAFDIASSLFRDVDRDGISELIVGSAVTNAIFKWDAPAKAWQKLPFTLPPGTALVDAQRRDAGLRFVDVNGDGYDDILFSNEDHWSLHLFRSTGENLRLQPGWTDEAAFIKHGEPGDIPSFVRNGQNNGAWFHSRQLFVQNEDTAHLPDKVFRRTFAELLHADKPTALSPADSLKAMRVRPGFTVELVAAEPLVQDPVAFEWGADGRLWVVEMADYPQGLDGHGQPGGRVRALEDTDGDGRYDKSTVFLDGVAFPTGCHPWRNGVIVSTAPDIFYAEDTDDDGKADKRVVLLTGFTKGNQQHRVNGFEYGLDGWLYAANGDSGGTIRSRVRADAGGTSASLSGRDLRFQPDTGELETIPGQTQFGRRRDDWGNWFGNANYTWLWHYHIPDHYLARNPSLAVKSVKTTLAQYPDALRLFPAGRVRNRFNDAHTAGHVTSACSPAPYRDELFGPDFATSVFISDPVHNLVHREVLEPDGVSFTSHRAAGETNREFLASSDPWFRPTMLKTGPDGALYLADMYRFVIEHPEWIPAPMQQRLDLRAGADRGRIYRVFPNGQPPRSLPRLAQLDTAGLVAALASPNGWTRDTAQRLLTERGAKAAAPALEKLVTTHANAKTRLQALATLNTLGGLRAETVAGAMKDAHPVVREQAVRLSEPFLAAGVTLPGDPGPGTNVALGVALLKLASDPDLRVRRQLAFSLGEWRSRPAAVLLANLANSEPGGEPNLRVAILSSAPRHAGEMLAAMNRYQIVRPSLRELEPELRKLATARPGEASTLIVSDKPLVVAPPRVDLPQLLKAYDGLEKLKGDPKRGVELYRANCAQCHPFKNEGHDLGPNLGTMTGKPLEQVLTAILDPNQAIEQRYRGWTAVKKDGDELNGLLVAETPTSVTVRQAGGAEHVLLRGELKALNASNLSLMPEGMEKALPPQSMADLLAFILGR